MTHTAVSHTIDADNKSIPDNNSKAVNNFSFIFSSLFIFGIYNHYIVNKIYFFNRVIVFFSGGIHLYDIVRDNKIIPDPVP
jgi:hypothetical protein